MALLYKRRRREDTQERLPGRIRTQCTESQGFNLHGARELAGPSSDAPLLTRTSYQQPAEDGADELETGLARRSSRSWVYDAR